MKLEQSQSAGGGDLLSGAARRSWLRTVLVAVGCLWFAFGSTAVAQEMTEEDPLGDIALDMQVVVTRLSKMNTDKPTQDTEATVVGKLDLLIRELEQRQRQQQQQAGGNGGRRPLDKSMIVGGPGGQGDMLAPQQNGKNWAQLPPKERARILQSQNEGFPAYYQDILARYFVGLAEEKQAGDLKRGGTHAVRASTGSDPAAPSGSGAAGKTGERP